MCAAATADQHITSFGVVQGSAPIVCLWPIPAAEIEGAVIDQVRGLLRSPEMIVRTWRAGRQFVAGLRESTVWARLDPVWEVLFPAEQARVIQLLVDRVEVSPGGVDRHH
jgi:hypothetical protein